MIRKAFKMKLLPGKAQEYTKRHNPVWPDLERVLRDHGASNYSIFLDAETDLLFAYVEVASESRWAAIADTEICRRWWAYMQELMYTHPDGSPQATDLEEVFYLP